MALLAASPEGGTALEPQRTNSPVVVPFQAIARYLVVVQGSVGPLDQLNLVVDTGTTRTVVDQTVADRLNLPRIPQTAQVFGEHVAASAVVVPSLAFAHLQVLDLHALAIDMAPLQTLMGFKPDALVGMDILQHHAFTIDYRARTMTFGARGGWRSVVPLEPDSPYPLVTTTIDGTTVRLIVDTGAAATVLFESAVGPALSIRYDAEVNALHVTGTRRLKRFTARRFNLGTHPLGSQPVFVLSGPAQTLGCDGVLATHLLPGGRVHFDFPGRTLSWR